MKKLLIILVLVGLLSSCDNSRQVFLDEDGHIHKIDVQSYSNRINVDDTVTIGSFFINEKLDGTYVHSLEVKQIENEFDTLADGKIRAIVYKKAVRIKSL